MSDIDVILVSDTQIKPGDSLDHISALGRYAAEKRPTHIVVIGDWWDMPSLSIWDKGTIHVSNATYKLDLEAGNEGKEIFMREIKRPKKKLPRIIFTEGNHEHRIYRYMEKRPELLGTMDFKADADLSGWEYYPFGHVVVVGGVHFSHYFANPMTGKPYPCSNMETMIKNIGYSFVQGHIQKFAYGRRDLTNGEVKTGLVSGAYYPHNERYKGEQGNNHWRGVCHMKRVREGHYDLEKISIETIMEDYG